jgi:hypothetical protein
MWLILDTAAGTRRVAAWVPGSGSIRSASFWVRLRPAAGWWGRSSAVLRRRTSTDETAVVIGAFRSLLVDHAAGLADDRTRLG